MTPRKAGDSIRPMDTISIRELEVHFHVGVPEEERERAQRLLIDIDMEHDFAAAAAEDDLGRTIDYYAVSRRILRLGEGRSWRLIESLAAEVATLVVAEFGVARATVEIKKFILPETRHVSVRTSRARS